MRARSQSEKIGKSSRVSRHRQKRKGNFVQRFGDAEGSGVSRALGGRVTAHSGPRERKGKGICTREKESNTGGSAGKEGEKNSEDNSAVYNSRSKGTEKG